MRQPLRSALIIAALVGGLWAAPGCGVAYRPYYDPGGSGASIDEFTYWSEPHMPQTLELVDLRTGETLFAVDIPPRQQLVVKFVKNHSEKDAWMPDLMKWELMPRGTKRGKLDNSMPVPPSFSRRLDLSMRQTPEMPDAPRYSQPAATAQQPVDWSEPAPAAEPISQRAAEPSAPPAVEPMGEPQTEPQTAPSADPQPVEPMSEPDPIIDLPEDQPGSTSPGSTPPGQMTPVRPRA